jgi:hypothetical protein
MAGVAEGEEVFANYIMLAVLPVFLILDLTGNLTPHKNMRMRAMIGLDLFEALIYPVNTVLAVNHVNNQAS